MLDFCVCAEASFENQQDHLVFFIGFRSFPSVCGDFDFYTLFKFGCVPWGPVLLQQLFSHAVSTEKSVCHRVCCNLFRGQQDRATTRKGLKGLITVLRVL